MPFGEAAAPRAILAEAGVQQLEHLVLRGAHAVVVDELGLSQLEEPREEALPRLREALRLAALAEFRNRLDVE